MNEAYICDAIRTPIGRFGGSLSSIRTDDLAALSLKDYQIIVMIAIERIIILAKEEHGLRWLKSIRLNLVTVAPMVFLVTGF